MNNILSCTTADKYFPVEIKEMVGMPQVLYYKGDITVLNKYKSVAVIGSRQSSERGLKLAYETGKKVAEFGMNLVNGLALGCDTEAIKGALDAGGRCVAIMPSSLEQIQPRSNEKLAQDIIDKGGCIISEYNTGTILKKYHYVERDRLQSGVSQGVLMVEAMENSGTMHTVEYALKQYKRLACYASKLIEYASGNAYIESTDRGTILNSESDVNRYLMSILQEPTFEQLSLF